MKLIRAIGRRRFSAFSDASFDRSGFQKKFDHMRPEENQYFDNQMKVYGLKDGNFLINHYWITGSVIIFPNRFYMWNVLDADEIKPHTLEIMQYVKPRPDYLIIGTGNEGRVFDDSFYDHFKRFGISVDACPTFEACSTFNLCIEDRYNVAVALLQPEIERNADGSEKMPGQNMDRQEEHISGMIGLGNQSFGKLETRDRELKKLMSGKDGPKQPWEI